MAAPARRKALKNIGKSPFPRTHLINTTETQCRENALLDGFVSELAARVF
jgi:hypothetical protein